MRKREMTNRGVPGLTAVLLFMVLAAWLTPHAAVAGLLQTSPVTVGFADFRPRLYAEDDCVFDGIFARFTGGTSPALCCAWAPVNLPDGVSVSTMVVYLEKGTDDDFSLSLVRKELGNTTSGETMGSVLSHPFPVSSQVRVGIDASISEPVIDNSRYTYFVRTGGCLSSHLNGIYSVSLYFD